MKSSSVTMFFLSLLSPVAVDAQAIYRSTRSFEEQQAISQIGQAEYYTRMALRSLEASEKIGKAPYFDYHSAREDIEKIVAEFNTYLRGDESTDLPPAVPLIVDGRYFAESITNFLVKQKGEEVASNLPTKSNDTRTATPKAPARNLPPAPKNTAAEKTPKILPQSSTTVLPPPVLTPQSSKAKRDKIEEILKKGL